MLKIFSRTSPYISNEHHVSRLQKRNFWHWLNKMFNQPDTDRIKQVGANRACAEWLLRNGAAVKWVGNMGTSKDYNALPTDGSSPIISEIDASDSSISHYGFKHLKGCKNIEKIVLHNCGYLQDEAIKELVHIDSALKYLQISKCPNITDAGLLSLPKINSLQRLVLFDLNGVKNINECKSQLNKLLPSCDMSDEQIK